MGLLGASTCVENITTNWRLARTRLYLLEALPWGQNEELELRETTGCYL